VTRTKAARLQVEDAELRVERARAETRTARELPEKHEKDLVFRFRLKLARVSEKKRAEFEREYPEKQSCFSQATIPRKIQIKTVVPARL
jgi:hypothetical protein